MAKNYGFIIDNRRCIGCHACTVACKSEHSVPVGVNRTWVKYIEKGTFPDSRRLFSVMRCNHCDNAPCVEICPVAALYRREDGIVDFDNRRCIGCKACMQACPYDALFIDPQTHTAAKCNYCAHRIDVGLEPACVVVCPTQAIVSGDLNDAESRISKLKSRQQVTARKIDKGTQPALFYINGDVASLDPMATEVASESLWGQQNRGVAQHVDLAETDSRHPLDRLGDWLSLGETTSTISNTVRSIRESLAGTPRRVYDAPQKGITWGWQVTAYLWTKGIAAGAVMVSTAATFWGSVSDRPGIHLLAAMIGLIFLALTGALLTIDLEQPRRFLYVLLRPQWRSWLVRGAYIITAFGLVLPIYGGLALFGWSSGFINGLAFLTGLATAVYTAFLFAQAKGRDYWQSPMLPFQMFAHSILLGAGVFGILIPFAQEFSFGSLIVGGWPWMVACVMAAAATLHLTCDFVDMSLSHSSVAAEKTAHAIFKGPYARMYWSGSFLMAGIVPILAWWIGRGWSLPIAGISALIGVYISQHLLVYVPQKLPLS